MGRRGLPARLGGAALLLALLPLGAVAVAMREEPAPDSPPVQVLPLPTAAPVPASDQDDSRLAEPLGSGEVWSPTPGTAWQWQLQGDVDLSVDVPVYDLDGFTTSRQTVAALRGAGRHSICYLNMGAWEDWRQDASRFPSQVLGAGNGWPGERWLDVRRLDALAPILSERIAMCQAKGFDAVEPDNIDGYAQDTGFPLTPADQLRFNRWLAEEAHRQGMSIALKNDLDQVPDLVDIFDFAINEQCFEFSECERLLPFVRAGKAVLHVEYDVPAEDFCGRVPLGFSSMQKRLDLGAWRRGC